MAKTFIKKPSKRDEAIEKANNHWNQCAFQDRWIKNGVDKEFVDFADKLGKFLVDDKLTNSKIRSIYGEMKRIQMRTFEEEKPSFFLMKPKVAYAVGRDDETAGLHLFKLFFDRCSQYVNDQKTFENFCNVFEAVLAYHKA